MEELKNEIDNLIEQYTKRADACLKMLTAEPWSTTHAVGLAAEHCRYLTTRAELGSLRTKHSCYLTTKAELERLRSLIKEEEKP